MSRYECVNVEDLREGMVLFTGARVTRSAAETEDPQFVTYVSDLSGEVTWARGTRVAITRCPCGCGASCEAECWHTSDWESEVTD